MLQQVEEKCERFVQNRENLINFRFLSIFQILLTKLIVFLLLIINYLFAPGGICNATEISTKPSKSARRTWRRDCSRTIFKFLNLIKHLLFFVENYVFGSNLANKIHFDKF